MSRWIPVTIDGDRHWLNEEHLDTFGEMHERIETRAQDGSTTVTFADAVDLVVTFSNGLQFKIDQTPEEFLEAAATGHLPPRE